MLQAKLALRQIVQDNQDKVSFMMSQYYQVGSGFDSGYKDAGERRFQYTSTTSASILRARADTADRGFQAWQDIQSGWNTLYYNEAKTSGGPAVCSATVPAGFYQQGSALATALTTAMNGATCTPARDATQNTYGVTYATGTGIFSFARTVLNRNFQMMWGTVGSNIKGALAAGGSTGMGTGAFTSGTPYTLLKSGNWPTGGGMGMTNSFTDGTPVQTYYQIGAARLWNGETLSVQADGYICGLTAATTKYNPAQLFVQTVAANCGANSGAPVVYTYSGVPITGNSSFCRGAENKVALVPCDLQPPAPSQFSMISPYLETELAFNADGTPKHYTEAVDGTWAATRWPAADNAGTPTVDEAEGGIRAAGGTPMANSLIDVKATFDDLWNNGQAGATTMAGPAPWQITPIKDHLSPKEKTIVLLVTDGNDTCATRTGDGSTDSRANALKVAHKAQQLYDGIGATPDAASRVQTYVIGYGNATSPDKMNWIAWGGSGLVAGASNPGLTRARARRSAGPPPMRRATPRSAAASRRSRRLRDLPGRLPRSGRRHTRRPAPGHHRPGRVVGRLQRAAVGDRVGVRVRDPGRPHPVRRRQPQAEVSGARPDPVHLQLLAARLQRPAARVPERRRRERHPHVERR